MSMRGAVLPLTVPAIERSERRRWAVVYVGVLGFLLGAVAATQVLVPAEAPIVDSGEVIVALVAMALAVVWTLAQPVVGVYLIVLLTLAGDNNTMPWYPFTKNFSSRESVLFLSDGVIVNPLEVMLLLTTVSWLLRSLGTYDWRLVRGRLLVPAAVFAALVLYGLVNGLGSGGDFHVGLWEARPLLYLPLFYLLVTNLLTSPRQYVRLMWLAMAAVTIQSVVSLLWYFSLDETARALREDLTEHSASIPIDVLIILLLGVFLLPRCSPGPKLLLPLAAIPAIWAYFLAERRSAFIALALGLLLFSFVLYRLHQRAFWWFVPIVVVVAAAYVAVFWNAEGAVAFPAQAIKGAIAPGQLEGKDQSSNVYREIEAINVWFTIRSSPVRGIGFGHIFHQIYALPRLDSFPFFQFMPHHSFLWIWLKTGFAGFVSMLVLVIRTIQHGARTVFRAPAGDLQLVSLAAVLYVGMYTVFSYVDIGWDTRSMIFFAMAMAICADLPSLLEPSTETPVSGHPDAGPRSSTSRRTPHTGEHG